MRCTCWDLSGLISGKKFAALPGLKLLAGVLGMTLACPTILRAQLHPTSAERAAPKAISVGTPEMSIDGPWQFHPGDSPMAVGSKMPLWADPSFDDSGWTQVKAKPLVNQKLPYTQFAWYRRRVTIDRQNRAQKLAVLVAALDTYAVYWNGRYLGSHGSVPPRFSWSYFAGAAFPLPLPDQPSVSGVLAVRVWCQYPSSIPTYCGILSPPRIGDSALEQARPQTWLLSNFVRNALFSGVAALALLAAMVALLVYLRGRRDLVYLWFAIFFLGAAAWNIPTTVLPSQNLQMSKVALASGAVDAGFLLLLIWLFGLQRRRHLRRIVAVVALLIAVMWTFDAVIVLCWVYAGVDMQRADAVSTVLGILLGLAPLILLGIAMGSKSAKRDWPVIVTGSAYFLSIELANISGQWHGIIHWHLDWIYYDYAVGYVHYDIPLLLLVLLLLALGFSVIRYFVAERRRQEHSEGELHAAREVQQVLVPEKVPSIPGYAIASVYRPASEVGGDFFQIFSLADGGTLVAIGDVSGKGLKAAMIVSLIVGALRTIANYTQEPGEILKQLNVRLHGRMSSGFVTCLVLRITASQEVVAAHAGHISPYIDGRECALEGSAPLGIVPGMEYEQVSLRLAEGETLTLLTDGVPEAQNERKELFGFERLETLLAAHPTAEQIVEAACAFGQQDDITVLKLTRLTAISAPA